MNQSHFRTISAASAILLATLMITPSIAFDGGVPGGYRSDNDHTNSNSSNWGGSDRTTSSSPSAPPGYHWEHIGGMQNDRDVLVADATPQPPAPPPLPTVTNYDPWVNTSVHDTVTRTVTSTHATVNEGTQMVDLNPMPIAGPGEFVVCAQDLTDITELAAGRPVIHKCHITYR